MGLELGSSVHMMWIFFPDVRSFELVSINPMYGEKCEFLSVMFAQCSPSLTCKSSAAPTTLLLSSFFFFWLHLKTYLLPSTRINIIIKFLGTYKPHHAPSLPCLEPMRIHFCLSQIRLLPASPHRDLTNMLGRRLPAQLERNLTTSDLATVKCLQARQAGTLLAPVWMGGVGGNSSQRNFFLFWMPNRVFSVSFCMSRCEQANVRARCIAYREMDWAKQIGMGFRVFDTARLQIFSLELV